MSSWPHLKVLRRISLWTPGREEPLLRAAAYLRESDRGAHIPPHPLIDSVDTTPQWEMENAVGGILR